MSVSSQITRISQAKTAIKAAIKAKGVDVPDTTLLDGMADAIKSIPSKDTIVHADIPDYIKTAALEVAKKVQAVRTSESIVFIAASDAHQLDTSADIVAGNKHAGMAMKALAYILPGIDFACYLGDYTAGSATKFTSPGRRAFHALTSGSNAARRAAASRRLSAFDAFSASRRSRLLAETPVTSVL